MKRERKNFVLVSEVSNEVVNQFFQNKLLKEQLEGLKLSPIYGETLQQLNSKLEELFDENAADESDAFRDITQSFEEMIEDFEFGIKRIAVSSGIQSFINLAGKRDIFACILAYVSKNTVEKLFVEITDNISSRVIEYKVGDKTPKEALEKIFDILEIDKSEN